MSPQFADVAPWPADSDRNIAGPKHNEPPIEERIVMDFAEKLVADGIASRIAELIAAADRAPDCTSAETAGKYGDLIKMAGAAVKRVDEAREGFNRPLLNAQRALKGKADGVVADLSDRATKLRTGLNGFLAEEEKKAAVERARLAEQHRAAEEAARKVREEQEAAAAEKGEALPEPVYEPVFVAHPVHAAPIARGDLGSRVGTTTVWDVVIESMRQLPNDVLCHPTVQESALKVLRQRVRSGERAIKGCLITSSLKAAVR
jgi:hypothetical protein